MIVFGEKLGKKRAEVPPVSPAKPSQALAQPAPLPVVEPVQAASPPEPAPAAAPEESAWRVLPLEGSFRFSYLDASGRPSLRRLVASELRVGPGKLLLGGMDADFEAYRGFRVDRIHSLQADTGEIVERNILDWLLDRAARQAREKAAREKAQRASARERGKPARDAARAAA